MAVLTKKEGLTLGQIQYSAKNLFDAIVKAHTKAELTAAAKELTDFLCSKPVFDVLSSGLGRQYLERFIRTDLISEAASHNKIPAKADWNLYSFIAKISAKYDIRP